MPTCPKSTSVPRFRLSLVREAESPYRGDLLDQPEAVAAWLWREIYHDAAQEQMSALFVDVRNRFIGYQVAFVGTLARAAVEPRAILAAALLCNAAGFILAHNHPSGNLIPSADDTEFTKAMRKAADLMGVDLHDHLIIGRNGYVSLRERGLF